MAADGYLLFVSRPTGYELRERDGEPPAPGEQLEDGAERLEVTKVAPSPIPGDGRRCAYALPLPR